MKKIFCLAFLAATLHFSASAHTEYAVSDYRQKGNTGKKSYLGFASGINNYTGFLGPTFEYQLTEKFTSFAGAGLGSWGYKLSAGLKYYGNFPEGWSFNLGFSHATGVSKVELELPEECVEFANGPEKVNFDLTGSSTINLSTMKYWNLGRSGKNRFNIELGYAVPIQINPYNVNSAHILTPTGRDFMNILQPGGMILGLGFSFGL